MRVSTSMFFDNNISALNDNATSLLRTQQQLSTGKRILAPSDDPVAASQVLELSQSAAMNKQYQSAQGMAQSSLGILDSQLSTVSDILGRVRELGVSAGSAALSNADRQSVATELRARFDELLGIANSTDGKGQYLFSGYQAANKPFAGSVADGVSYFGDEGQRAVRVSGTRVMSTSVSGSDLFTNIKNGNGFFVTAPQTAPANTGTGVIDAGTVGNPALWNSSNNSGQLSVRIWQDPADSQRYYDLVDDASGNSLFTGAPSTPGAGGTFTHAYTSGNAIPFSGLVAPYNDLGASVIINGTPASGDSFTLERSTSSSLFNMIADMITAAEQPNVSTPGGNTLRNNQINAALTDLSQVEDNVLRVRADIGTRLAELDDLASASAGLDIQYKSRISELQDVDYNVGISELMRQQTQLQAAQQSFAKVSGMSLFNYL